MGWIEGIYNEDWGILGGGCEFSEGVYMYVLKTVLNNVDRSNWYAQLNCTVEGKYLMLCNRKVQHLAVYLCSLLFPA